MQNTTPTAAPIDRKWDDLSTSWGNEANSRWNTFRVAVKSGTTADQAADRAGIDRIPSAPKAAFDW